jgi:hypothetical protein
MTLAVRSESNAVAVPTESQPHGNQQIAYIATWAQAADAALRVATELVETSFVPVAYRKKPMEATAAILAGAEVGLNPMASLRAFDNIQGTPAPKAITLRAIVQGQGHEVRIEKSDDTVAIVAARRRGDTEWQRSTWTIQRAQKMGLTGKDQWKAQPTAMLVARATSEVCRWVASDAIMGMPYSVEELQDGDGAEVRETPRRVSLDEIDAAEEQHPATEAKPAEHQASAVEVSLPVREAQRKHMFALWRDLGYEGDENREQRLVITTKILGLPETIVSSANLTEVQADTVIAALTAKRDAEQGQAVPQDGAA